MKIIYNVCRVLLAALLAMPILGALGIFPPPTPEMYTNPNAYAFINALATGGYIMPIMALVFAVSIFLIATNRTALAALLILPVTVNIVGFHAFLDGGLFTAGAVMGNVLALLNVYFLWINRALYKPITAKTQL